MVNVAARETENEITGQKVGFHKPIYNLPSAVRDLGKLLAATPLLLSAVTGRRVDGAFREKIMLACTGFNVCRYCGFVHAHWALALKVDPEEIKALLRQTVDERFSEKERPALEFAQRFAATRGRPGKQAMARLQSVYERKTAREINAFLKLIFFMNLSGNTFDAFLSRLAGRNAPKSHPLFEAFYAVLAGPILLPVLAVLTVRAKLDKEADGVMAAIPK